MSRALGLCLLLLTTPFLGCPQDRTCGEGTRLSDGLCVPVEADVECGPSTTLIGGQCVPDEGQGPRSCGAGTVLVGDACVALTTDAGPEDRCGAGTVLVGDECVAVSDGGACVPDCLGRTCGSDGCGGSCGACDDPSLPQCDEIAGLCIAICVPQCAGRTCGDDGCGGTCGTCDNDATCRADLGRCVPDAWSCNDTYYGGGDICDCACGAPDPDCALGAPVAGCDDQERCNDQGQCVPKAPSEWTCSALSYAANNACDCGCGAYDPDCDFAEIVGITGCGVGVTECLSDGTCGTCTPDCTDRQCGDDGCGGSCGTCDTGAEEVCFAGACVERCGDTPVLCRTNDCGDDGCEGSCGTCSAGSNCEEGQCITDPIVQTPFSCFGRCGSAAPSGCYCTDNCASFGNCCDDFADYCECVPDCAGRACGSDGCGGSCGDCGAGAPYCTGAGQCTDQCTPSCGDRQCGDDGCGGSCGTCGADEVCYWTSQCLPEAWTCDGFLFGGEDGCDCGCGAADPDCAVENAAVFGCPVQEPVCGVDGLCDVTLCHGNEDCAGAQWCTGAYAAGEQRFGGYCADPIAGGAPPGAACEIHEECASLACVSSQCRLHCESDLSCAGETVCVGLPVKDPGTRLIQGYAGVCDLIAGSAAPCASQASCASGERCIVVMDPGPQSARFLCSAVLEENAYGASCDFAACPSGYRCEDTDAGRVCTLPCPAGAADCPSGMACVQRPLAPLLDNGETVPVCLPE